MANQLQSILDRCQDYSSLGSETSSLDTNYHDPYEIVFGENKEVICELIGQSNEHLDTNRRTFRPNPAVISLPASVKVPTPAPEPQVQEHESQEPARPLVVAKPQVAQTEVESKKKENQNDKLIGLVEYFFTKCI